MRIISRMRLTPYPLFEIDILPEVCSVKYSAVRLCTSLRETADILASLMLSVKRMKNIYQQADS